MKEALRSSETSVLTRATRRNIPEDTILHRLRVFENMILRRIFGPKWDGVTRGYPSSSIIRIIRPRRMRWVGHIARMGEKRNVYGVIGRKVKRKEIARKTRT
jgi:hypothetical protein